MLKHLTISNYALIKSLDIDFKTAFTVITGETGAGKSIILGAIGLLLGNRADANILLDKNNKCVIKGVFAIDNLGINQFFNDNELDYTSNCIIRREITANGKSRAFINDTPVNLNQLKELAEQLVDIHSQHQTLLLRENSFQLSVLDSFANNQNLLVEYQELFFKYKSVIKQIDELENIKLNAKKEIDYLQFLFEELSNANLKEDEQDKLEEEARILTNAEDIKRRFSAVIDYFVKDDNNLIDNLKLVINLLSGVNKFMPELSSSNDRLNEILIDLHDIYLEIERKNESLIFDNERVNCINDRLNLIYNLEHKHNVASVSQLIETHNNIGNKLNSFELNDNKLDNLKASLAKLTDDLEIKGKELTESRKKAALAFEKGIKSAIIDIGMKHSDFKVDIITHQNLQLDGNDKINFLFNANKGSNLSDISKVASGGELSRIMLAVKSLVSSSKLLPTIIFDEIDTGVSGDIATKVGLILQKMSNVMQVIAITHHAQIVSKSKEHFKVAKIVKDNSAITTINRLDYAERVDELALMMSGNLNSDAAKTVAKELLSNNY